MNAEITPEDEDWMEKFIRTADLDCYLCGKKYSNHNRIRDYPTFRKLCDGSFVKL